MKTAISMSNVSVSIDGTAILTDISAELTAGTITGLIGPSGAGKTTLIRALLGLQQPTSGSLRVLGLPAGASPLHAKVGYVTQAPAVYSDITVKDNLSYFAALLDAPVAQVTHIMEQVELTDFADALVSTLSGGQHTRVSLAAALLGTPEVLLLDEPTVGLDPVLREKLWETFRTLASKGITLLISSHVMEEAYRCDELLFLRDGKLLASGTPVDIMHRAHTGSMDRAFLSLAQGASL